jgi:hypothetical protein
VSSRVTKDLDTTVRGFALTQESAERVFREIAAIDLDDDLSFRFVRTENIRETGDYPGIRVFLRALYPPLEVPLSVDVTTGDAITPGAIEYRFPLVFDNRSINILAYPTTTVMAEKLETVVVRGITNTRPRDYYDIYTLWKVRRNELAPESFGEALKATCLRRGSLNLMENYHEVMEQVQADKGMLGRWDAYTKSYSYAKGLKLADACQAVCDALDSANWHFRNNN